MADPRFVLRDLVNGLRANHKSPPLTLTQKLCDEAQAWAENLARTGNFGIQDGKLQLIYYCMSPGGGNMENAVRGAYKNWENTKQNYDFNNPSPTSFSLLVWKDTKEFGVGVACRGDNTYVVLQVPCGNLRGSFQQNVFP